MKTLQEHNESRESLLALLSGQVLAGVLCNGCNHEMVRDGLIDVVYRHPFESYEVSCSNCLAIGRMVR